MYKIKEKINILNKIGLNIDTVFLKLHLTYAFNIHTLINMVFYQP